MAERIGFIGLGIMGRPMAANLARAGFEVLAWNRTRERAEELAAEFDNVTVAASPAEAGSAGIAISMVPDAPEVEAVLLGEDGAVDGLPEGGLAVDMSTIPPTASRAIGERLGERGIAFVDAPVTGSRPRAEDGTLAIMAGGPQEAVDRARPAFDAMGRLVLHVGPQGHGSMIKLINNTLGAVNAAGLAEGIVIAQAAGLDVDKMLEVVGSGSGESAMLALKSESMVGGDFEALFKLEHMLKDVRYCIAEARKLGLQPAMAQAAEKYYSKAEVSGHGESDFSAVIEAIRR